MARCGLSPLAPHRNGLVGTDPPALKTGRAGCDPRGFWDSGVSPLRATSTVTHHPSFLCGHRESWAARLPGAGRTGCFGL